MSTLSDEAFLSFILLQVGGDDDQMSFFMGIPQRALPTGVGTYRPLETRTTTSSTPAVSAGDHTTSQLNVFLPVMPAPTASGSTSSGAVDTGPQNSPGYNEHYHL